ncbi:unnamed protein product [Chrysodeixis includens]|uniref:Uncharacterized protein n=1 Tax=Chrysodeixis includens TaxID=689277 RepID=A0A9N8L3W1_CHRIL|nr:unnamed protein product [Chrysodeixis includens]
MGTNAMFLLLFPLVISTSADHEIAVMRSVTASVGDVVLECQNEMHFDNVVIHDLVNIWTESNELLNPETGCVMLCVLVKMELVDHGGKVQKAESDAFLRAMGADDRIAGKLVELFELCQRATSRIKDMCEFALQMTKCFRYGIFELRWVPHYTVPNATDTMGKRNTEQMWEERDVRRHGRNNRRRRTNKKSRFY